MAAPRERVAFVGLGMMGYPMAARLAAAGYLLAVHDLNGETLARFAREFPCRPCTSVGDAARDADFLITMLPGSDHVFAAVLGDEASPGAASVLRPGTMVLDMSSSEPLRTRELAAVLERRAITLVDAPVSGGAKKAQQGTLAIMVGGTSEGLIRCRPVLEAIGTSIFHTGGVGSAHAMKALNNYVSAAGLVAAVEALHVGAKFGLDPRVMTEVLNASTGRNNTTENKVAQFMLSGAFNSGFSLALMTKDLGIAMGLADSLSVPATLGHACLALWRDATARSDKAADHTEMYRLMDVQ